MGLCEARRHGSGSELLSNELEGHGICEANEWSFVDGAPLESAMTSEASEQPKVKLPTRSQPLETWETIIDRNTVPWCHG